MRCGCDGRAPACRIYKNEVAGVASEEAELEKVDMAGSTLMFSGGL